MRQTTIFEWINRTDVSIDELKHHLGEYIEKNRLYKRGKSLKFEDMHNGDIVIVDKSTQNHVWSQIVMIVHVFNDDDPRITYKETITGKETSLIRKHWVQENDLMFKIEKD